MCYKKYISVGALDNCWGFGKGAIILPMGGGGVLWGKALLENFEVFEAPK